MSGLESRLKTLKAVNAMNRNVVVLSPDDSLERAGEIFEGSGVSSAPVVDGDHQCVGVLSAVDFLRQVDQRKTARVRDVMTTEVKTIRVDDTLIQAAHLMSARHIHRLPVVGEGNRVVGVLSTMDLVAAVLNALDEADAHTQHYAS